MAAKKKTKKKQTKLKQSAAKRKPLKKTSKQKLAKKKTSPKKKLAKKKPASKKVVLKTKVPVKKKVSAQGAGDARRRVSGNQSLDTEAFALQGQTARSAGQSGDLQGLSNVEGADSESVDELIEEGNAFEADVVAGVESAGDAEEKEVHTHEVSEDDIPGEYLDKD